MVTAPVACLLAVATFTANHLTTAQQGQNGEDCYVIGEDNSAVYWGQKNTTENGRTCQRWIDQTPHEHENGPSLISQGAPDVKSQANFCRDPDGERGPWCYTTDPEVRWEYCSVAYCKACATTTGADDVMIVPTNPALSTGEDCAVIGEDNRAVYWGQKNTTENGRTCQRWDAQTPHEHDQGPRLKSLGAPDVESQANFCRDPDGERRPWCYTTDPEVRMEYCNVAYCSACATTTGADDGMIVPTNSALSTDIVTYNVSYTKSIINLRLKSQIKVTLVGTRGRAPPVYFNPRAFSIGQSTQTVSVTGHSIGKIITAELEADGLSFNVGSFGTVTVTSSDGQRVELSD